MTLLWHQTIDQCLCCVVLVKLWKKQYLNICACDNNVLHYNNLFHKYQAGFLPGHSTVYQWIEMYHNIVKSIDEGKSCCVVFCDLSKAVDRIWHKGILFKLEIYEIPGGHLHWFNSYLSNKTQKVMYKDILSSTSCIKVGVLQGSVLGPLRFLLYVNDVSENMLSLCRHFADDNCIQYSSQNISCIEHNINHVLLLLEQWSSKWLLRFNPSKAKAAFLTLKSSYELPKTFFQHCQLEYIPTHKHLGLHLASDLKWANYIHFYVNEAYNTLGLLKKTQI